MPPAQWIDRIQRWAVMEPLVKEVWVFGSYARGDQTSESDLDLAIILPCEPQNMLLAWMVNAARWRTSLDAILPEVKPQIEPGDHELSPEIVSSALRNSGVCIFQRQRTVCSTT